jgi:hypothetical protein
MSSSGTLFAPAILTGRRVGLGSGALVLQDGPPSTLGAIWGSSGSVTRAGGVGLVFGALGEVRGDSGAITQGMRIGVQGGLGVISGNPGSINHRAGAGLVIGQIGSIRGDSGAIQGRYGMSPIGGLNAVRGDSGAVVRIPGFGASGPLGAIRGDSGSIDRSYRVIGGLGQVSGDSGAVTHRPGFGLIGGLGAVSGNPGAITRGSGFGSSGGLGATSGSSGAISRNGGFGSRGGLGATFGSSGAISRDRSFGSTGALGAKGPVGSRSFGGVRKRKAKAPVWVDACCGDPVSGSLQLEVEWEFDAWGNPIPPKVKTWRAEINGKVWTPEDWQFYQDMPSHPDRVDVQTPTSLSQSLDFTWGECLTVALDFPDPAGKLIARTEVVADPGVETPLTAAPGQCTHVAFTGVWPT